MTLIDKEEALTAIANAIRELHNEDAIVVGEKIEEIGLRTAFDIIKRLPTVEEQQKGKWIPCSERLPDKGLRVLMQLDNSWQIVGWYDKEDKQWYTLPFSQEVVNDCVLAWMELPQVYEPQESEDKEC